MDWTLRSAASANPLLFFKLFLYIFNMVTWETAQELILHPLETALFVKSFFCLNAPKTRETTAEDDSDKKHFFPNNKKKD